MIELPSEIAVLAGEALAVMFALLIVIALRAGLKRRREDQHTGQLVDRLSQDRDPHATTLACNLAESPHWSETEASEFADTITRREHALYHCVIESFVRRDAATLDRLDEHVHGLSEPYCEALKRLLSRVAADSAQPQSDETQSGRAKSAESLEELEALRQRADELAIENEQVRVQLGETEAARESLQQELQKAVTALDEVSTEYARVFQAKSDTELEESRQAMLRQFRLAAGLMEDEADASEDGLP